MPCFLLVPFFSGYYFEAEYFCPVIIHTPNFWFIDLPLIIAHNYDYAENFQVKATLTSNSQIICL
jgi:hypothetical protein